MSKQDSSQEGELLVVCKLSYNHRESGLWETRRWAKVGDRALMQPWPSATTLTLPGKVMAVDLQIALHGVNSPSVGLNHTLTHSAILTHLHIL